MDRITQLEEFLKEDPDDAFSAYALALEYLKSDQQRSHDLFSTLLKKKPDYLPTYYPFAHLLIELQQPDKAESIFKQGIDLARRKNDSKTLKELTSAYNDWLFEQS
ncbi:MAG TPA: tetratricopeptide repeat protein [Cyclobacteriaceae bacterium]|nr:tetratricopeptide repeat protein [Cyclobacteriaceae bacterium]